MAIQRRQGQRGVSYEVRYRAPDGTERSRSFKSMRTARAYEGEQRSAVERAGWVDPRSGSTPFETVAAEWLTSNPGKRPGSIARDEIEIRLRLIPAFRGWPLATISPSDIQELVNAWSKTAQPRTVHRRYGVLRAILNHAVNRDMIARSPCRGIKLPSREHVDRTLPTPQDVAALGEALGDYEPMLYLGVVLGMRWGEVAGLRVGRLDLEAGTCSVVEQVTRGPLGASVLGAPKSHAGRRVLAMPEALTRMLTDHLAKIGASADDRDAFVFPAPGGGHLIYNNWRERVWRPACRAIGRSGLGFHDLRRANATSLVAAGVDIRTAQERLGHSDPRLTLAIYAQATTEADRRAADLMGERFMSEPREIRGKKQARPAEHQLDLGL